MQKLASKTALSSLYIFAAKRGFVMTPLIYTGFQHLYNPRRVYASRTLRDMACRLAYLNNKTS